MIGQMILHYRILEKLGEGGMGVVYKAEDTKLKRTVALKFLPKEISEHPQEKARFVHEAQAASSLNHPNVTTIHGIETSPQGDFIVMEYVEGRTLKEIAGKDELRVKDVLDIGIQVCEGLTAAHEKGIVHRDIKSSNIMITPKGRVKIMDFGLAKRKDAEQITQTPSTLGTVAYMSPEQASGEQVDRRSDIFSLGVVLYELLTGRLPFEGEHMAAIIYSILNEEPQSIVRYNSRVSGRLGEVVRKALSKDREERYQHSDDLMADLKHERRALEYVRFGQVSGDTQGTGMEISPEVKKWNWGAFFLNWIWGIGNNTKIALLCLIPFVNLVMVFILGEKGSEWAWRNNRWESIEHFRNVQRKWAWWGLGWFLFQIVLVIFIAITPPFRLEISPHRGAVAQEHSLAIMYFENVAEPGDQNRIAQMVTSLLITDLSESQYMRVMSRQRLYDILKLMGKEDIKVIDMTVATEVAEKAGVKFIMTGSILQTEPVMVITAEISEAASGKIIASERVTGGEGEDLFAVVDRLSAQAKLDLSLPEEARTEPDRSVADVTTHSPEAYRHYLEGMDYLRKVYNAEAEESFQKALEYDSTFAMAYFRLGLLKTDEERGDLMAKARQYSDRVSQKEKLFIQSMSEVAGEKRLEGIDELEKLAERYPDDKEVHYWLGAFYSQLPERREEAVGSLSRAIEIDPLYKMAYNMLAYTYDKLGDFERSLWAINKYASIAPDEANPYDTRGDLYAFNGQIDQAMASYRQAVEVKSDFYPSLIKLGHMHLYRLEYARAESCYKAVASCDDRDYRAAGRTLLALIPMHQGRLEEALEVLDHGIAADQMEQVGGVRNAFKHYLKAEIYARKQQWDLALRETNQGREVQLEAAPETPVGSRDFLACVLVESGRESEAREVLEELRRDLERQAPVLLYSCWQALGCVELFTGNAEKAVADLEKAVDEALETPFLGRVFLAKAYLEVGKHGEAVTLLEATLGRYDEARAIRPIWSVRAHYYLGLAYERSGWDRKAIEQYEEFLKIWKEADPALAEVEDARERLERLRAQS
jgi:tetratricopeptide (TPR) repeat protein/tRNA A-37 threonylcarbamoyl transferase component Bud32